VIGEVEAVLLDAGNTLVSIDFDAIAQRLAPHGVTIDARTLHRAEAAARPDVSRWLQTRGKSKADDAFARYLEVIFTRAAALADRAGELAVALAPGLVSPGGPGTLWRWVLPGVREGLERLHALGISLAVVSNSDGSVARVLRELELDARLVTVVDSAVVGVEKPDPRIFAPALEACNVKPANALYVGDLYYPDVVGARAAGLVPVLLDPFGDWPDLDCDAVADLPALAAALEQPLV
jgi:putative hydrolase of the HAD superfamily